MRRSTRFCSAASRIVLRPAVPATRRAAPSHRAAPTAPPTHAAPRSLLRSLVTRASPTMAAPYTTAADNPLLEDTVLPAFDRITADHVVPGIRTLLATLSSELDAIEAAAAAAAAAGTVTYDAVVPPLEALTDRLGRAWGAVQHLKAVKDSEPLRAAVDTVQPDRVAFSLRLAQSRPLYDAFTAIKANPAVWGALTPAQQRCVDIELRDFRLGGVGLDGSAKARFNEIQQELSKLATAFSNNVLDATKAYKKLVTDPAIVDGLPPSARGLAAQQAADAGHAGATADAGPWLLTLDAPVYMPVLTHAKNRELREEFYRAYITRASSQAAPLPDGGAPPAGDNEPLIEQTLALRREKAALLGFDSYADLSMASKMATLATARGLLDRLTAASRAAAERELAEVTAFARDECGWPADQELALWDISYYAERQREAKYDLTDEALRPYFALPAVLDGLFALVKRLFGVDVVPADGDAPVWHPDVRFFRVTRGGAPVAAFYLDPYSRPAEKRGGAWMDEVVGRSAACAPAGAAVRLPVAHLVCNQSPPVGDAPSLMTFREVETLFHEAGHGLQHMLTQQADGLVSGIRGVDWDAVELPSQFMENFCYDKKTLDSFARHIETGEPLPDAMYDRLCAARTYRAGSFTLRQVNFAATDLFLHSDYAGGGVYGSGALDAVNAATTVVPPLPTDRFLCGFSHIFAGGYSAGYYSYAWAEVLSADAFEAFEEAGLDDEAAVAATGRRFADTVLALGGGAPPADVYRAFRGRDATPDALLRSKGLLATA